MLHGTPEAMRSHERAFAVSTSTAAVSTTTTDAAGTKPSLTASADDKAPATASANAKPSSTASADAKPSSAASANAKADLKMIAQSFSDEDDDDYDLSGVFQDPGTTYITRQLVPKNVEINPCDTYTVDEYLTSVENNWHKYVGDVVHYRNPAFNLYFLVLDVQELTEDSKSKSKGAKGDKKCLMVRELTNNPEFVDVVIVLTSQDITNLIQSDVRDEPEVIVYEAGSPYDMAHVPFGATVRTGIQDCRRWIDYARENGKLVTWATRARGAGLYAESTKALRSKLMCTQQRNMATPEIRELVASINIQKSIREAMLARWLIPVANAQDASFTWLKAKTEVEDLETLMYDAETCDDSFWYGPFLDKLRGAVQKYAEKVKHKNVKCTVPMISDVNSEVNLFEDLCFDKTLTTEVGPFYICEAERIEEGFLLGTKTEGLPRKGELVDVTRCNGICSNMSKLELEHYRLVQLIERAKADPAVEVPDHMRRKMRRMEHPDLSDLLSRKRTRSPCTTLGEHAVECHGLKKK